MGRKLCLKRKTRLEVPVYDGVLLHMYIKVLQLPERRRTFTRLATQSSGSQYSSFF